MKGSKYDRMARLLHVLHILNYNPNGISPARIAGQCRVSVRTTYRDLLALEDWEQLNIPIVRGGGKCRLEPGKVLPPIIFNLPEAVTIFLSSRLLLEYSNAYNPSIESTFTKLSSAVPIPLREQIRKTIEWMHTRKQNKRFIQTLELLAMAWTQGHRVRMWYWTLGESKPTERVVEPYFIQPAALEHGNYVIAYCHRVKDVRIFKIERIDSIELMDEQYSVPEDFDANKYLASYWGITTYGIAETIKLKFSPDVARIAEETMWHPSQVNDMQADGSAIVTMNLAVTTELITFIMGWAEKVEVLEPERLRRQISDTAKTMLNMYREITSLTDNNE